MGSLAETLHDSTSSPSTTAGLQEIEPMKNTLSLLLFVVLAWPLSVFGEASSSDPSLRGVKVVDVLVGGDFNEETKRDGFDPSTYQTVVEFVLRQRGVPIYDIVEMAEGAYNDYGDNYLGFLYVNLMTVKIDECRTPSYAVSILFNFRGYGDNPTEGLMLRRFDVGVYSVDELEAIEDQLASMTNAFADYYLAANPPEPRSGQGGE